MLKPPSNSLIVIYRINTVFLKITCFFLIFQTSGYVLDLQAQPTKPLNIKLPALIPYRSGSLWGYADSTGAIKVKPKYRMVKPLEHGVAQVADQYAWGLLDQDGKEIVKPQYREVNPIGNGLIIVSNSDSEEGVINLKGEEIVPLVYKSVSLNNLPDGKTQVLQVYIEKRLTPAEQLNSRGSTKTVYGLFNTKGKKILPVEYDQILYLGEDLIRACTETKCTVINTEGKVILPLKAHQPGLFQEGFLLLCEGQKCGFTDKNGKVIIPLKYDGAHEFSEGLAAVGKDGKWGFINKEGKMVIEPKYGARVIGLEDKFTNGLAIVRKDRSVGLIDKQGNELTDFSHTKIHYSNYNNTYTLSNKAGGNKAYYNSKTGKLFMPTDFHIMEGYQSGLALIAKGNKKGFVNEAGVEVIPADYDDARTFIDGIAAVKKGYLWGVVDKTGKNLLPFAFPELAVIDPDLILVGIKSGFQGAMLYGLINSAGEEVAPVKYTRIEPFDNGLAIVHQNGTLGIINKKGQEVIPPVKLPDGHRLCGGWENGLIRICSDVGGKEGYLDRYGKTYFTN